MYRYFGRRVVCACRVLGRLVVCYRSKLIMLLHDCYTNCIKTKDVFQYGYRYVLSHHLIDDRFSVSSSLDGFHASVLDRPYPLMHQFWMGTLRSKVSKTQQNHTKSGYFRHHALIHRWFDQFWMCLYPVFWGEF
jgi:hypothetical protein